MVPGLTNTNASLAAENSRLNDRMAKLVKDLTEEHKHLLDENQRLNGTVQRVRDSASLLPFWQARLTVCKNPESMHIMHVIRFCTAQQCKWM